MTITIYRHELTLTRADGYRLYSATCWTFSPYPGGSTISSLSGAVSCRTESVPVSVTVPPFSQVERGRLLLERDREGWPAEMVATAAEGKRGGFSWAEK